MKASSTPEYRKIAWLAALLFLLIQLRFSFPGTYIVDSQDQLDQALTGAFNDWHPPVMAVFWRELITLTGTPHSLYVLQTVAFWTALGIIANALLRSHRPRLAGGVLLTGLFPLFIYTNSLVSKDIQMSVAFLMCFALSFWFRSQARAMPGFVQLCALAFLLYGLLVRSNSIFAFGPLCIYLFIGATPLSYPRLLLLSLPLSAAGLAFCLMLNQHMPQVKQTMPARSLQLFDIAGIAKNSGDMSALRELLPIDRTRLEKCYTAYWWDSLAPWGPCQEISAPVMNIEDHPIKSERDVYPASAKLTRLWLRSLLHHPWAYAAHRLKHFNAELNFIVPSLVRRFGIVYSEHTPDDVKRDLVRKNFLFWPATWLSIAILVLTAQRNRPPDAVSYPARLLLASSLFYACAYLLVGVASETRYMHWPMLGIFISMIFSAAELKARLLARDKAVLAACGIVLATVLAGLYARIEEVRTLLN